MSLRSLSFLMRHGLNEVPHQSLFGGGAPAPAPAPTPLPPPRMPDPQSPDVMAARLRAGTDAMAAGGRSSTVLTTNQNRTLAGGAYGGKALGG